MSTMTAEPVDYKYIQLWGQHMGSSRNDINEQVAQARRGKAPENAIYWHKEDGWRTTDTLYNDHARHALGLEPFAVTLENVHTVAEVHGKGLPYGEPLIRDAFTSIILHFDTINQALDFINYAERRGPIMDLSQPLVSIHDQVYVELVFTAQPSV